MNRPGSPSPRIRAGIVVRLCRSGLLVGLALATLRPGTPAQATTWNVAVESFDFNPKDITIVQGDSVRWNWVFGTHTVTEGSNCVVQNPLFNSPSDPTHPVFIYRFDTPGLVNYFCELHCVTMGMYGSVTVLSSSQTPGGQRTPSPFGLEARPNPALGPISISFALASATSLDLQVLDSAGRRIRTLLKGEVEAGEHRLLWDGNDAGGRAVPTGIYFLAGIGKGVKAETRVMVLH